MHTLYENMTSQCEDTSVFLNTVTGMKTFISEAGVTEWIIMILSTIFFINK